MPSHTRLLGLLLAAALLAPGCCACHSAKWNSCSQPCDPCGGGFGWSESFGSCVDYGNAAYPGGSCGCGGSGYYPAAGMSPGVPQTYGSCAACGDGGVNNYNNYAPQPHPVAPPAANPIQVEPNVIPEPPPVAGDQAAQLRPVPQPYSPNQYFPPQANSGQWSGGVRPAAYMAPIQPSRPMGR